MRLLIEEGNTVTTAWFQGWSGLKNGALLDAAEEAGFELFITADQELRYQQNFEDRKIAVLALSTNNWAFIKAHATLIVDAISAVRQGSYVEVQIPERLR